MRVRAPLEIETIQPAERRVVLVLHANILGQQLALDKHRLARQVELGDLAFLQRGDKIKEADGEAAAAAKAALGRQVRHDRQVQRLGRRCNAG